MTSAGADRPEARRRPRPAVDEDVDPIDVTPRPLLGTAVVRAPMESERQQAGRPSIAAVPPTSASQMFVTLNVRVEPEVNDLLTKAMATGMSKRAAVERAIRSTYGGG